MSSQQLTFDLSHPPSWRDDDFLVSEANWEAAAWVRRWPDWPATALLLYGAEGSGKTHLARAFAARTGAALMDFADLVQLASAAPALDPEVLIGGAPALVVEDADRGLTAAGEEGLLHLYNVLAQAGGHLLITARRPVRHWALTLPDLRSRLLAAQAVSIGPPDDALMAAVLVKLFADRQLKVDDDVVAFLVIRIERSFAAAEHLVSRIDSAALSHQRPITVPFVRHLLVNEIESASGH